MPIKTEVDAKKEPHGPDDALEILGKSSRLVAAKGKKILDYDLKKDRPEDEELLKAVIGPSGNLRAPTLIVGKTVLVGFNEDAYGEIFG